MLRGRLILEWSIIALLATAVVIAALYSGVTRRIDNLLYDTAAIARAAPPSDRILIVEIDNYSLAKLGKWQWPRDIHARMLSALAAAQPKVIAYDVLFVEPSDPASDAALSAAMTSAPPVILPVLYNSPGLNGADFDIIRPIAPLDDEAAGLGSVNLLFDQDGLVRRAQLETRNETSGGVRHLMEMTYRAAQGGPSPVYQRQIATLKKSAASQDDESDDIQIPFLAAGSFRHVSFSSVLAGEIPAKFIKDKIILVGATADGLGDRYPVAAAAGSTMSGIEIQANLLNGLLNDRFIERAPFWFSLIASLLPVWLLMLIFLNWRPTANLVTSLGLIFAVVALSAIGVAFAGFWFPPGPALIGLLLVYPLWGWRRLEALSSFVFAEAKALKAEAGMGVTGANDHGGLDQVASEALQLRSVIGELRGVRRFMSDVVSGFPDAICVVDKTGNVILANTAAQGVLGGGAARHKIEDQPINQLLNLASSGVHLGADEMTLKDGRTFLIRQVPLAPDDNESSGSIVRFVDISSMRAAEREREEILEFLSHDMRAPQAAIIALLETEGKPATDSDLWTRVNDYARKTLKLADDFVQHARLSATELALVDVDVASAMTEAIDAVWPQMVRKAIQVERTGLDQEVYISGDYAALVRAFTNLIDNAVRHSPPESAITCRIVLDRDDHGQDVVRCSVIDRGSGLSPSRTDDLFARFGAVGSGSKSGSGLGLSYVKKVVDRLGGSIDWSSDTGQGTRFTLTLPSILNPAPRAE